MPIKFTLTTVPLVEKIFFIQNLALMLRTGFPLADALAALNLQSKNKLLTTTINQLHEDVLKGESFASALSKHPLVFDDLFVNMIAAGETSGNLEKTLHQLTIQLKKSYGLKKRVIQALIYPCIIVAAMIIAGTFMFIYVIPKILALYSDTSKLPLPTKVIIIASTFAQNNILLILSLVVACVVGFVVLRRTTNGQYWLASIALRLPIFGKIIKKVNIAKISRLLNSLIITDISIVRSFQIITQTLGNRVYRRYLEQSSEHLSKGNSIYNLLKQRPDLFDPVIAQMINVGETSGSLDEITQEIALFYEDEVDSTMANLATIIEPVIMIVIGVAVGFLAVAIIMPIYGMVDQI
ncbi:MAG: type II secretion system F family protein [Patescibacteria group bacterium]|jgi:type IV pilus assembly protein PilC